MSASKEEAAVRHERDGAIAHLILNRPVTLNALTPELASALIGELARVAADKTVRALVLRGAGRAFMAGGDLIYLRDSNPEQAFERSGALISLVGYRRAIQFAFLETRLTAAKALDWGLVNTLVPTSNLDARAEETTRRLADLPMRAFAETKRLLQIASETSRDMQLDEERHAFQRCSQTGDLREGVQAFFEQRPARFADARL